MNLNEREYKKLCSIAYDKAGINLQKGKESLVSARVAKRLRALNFSNVRQYLNLLANDEDGKELIEFLDVISTNFTSFFREIKHFEVMEKYVKTWIKNGQQRFRIWCAASSSGEEPYSLAITMEEIVSGSSTNYRILATDISTKVLRMAQKGEYDTSSIAPIKKSHMQKYFDRLGKRGDKDCIYMVKENLKKKIVFKRLNLSIVPFPMPGPLDIVFCRNVMIYFDNKVRQKLISNIEQILKPGGLLMIGHTETLTSLSHGLKVVCPSIFQKPNNEN